MQPNSKYETNSNDKKPNAPNFAGASFTAGSDLQPNVIKLSNIKKHFIVVQASCPCGIQAGGLYHHVEIYQGGTFYLNFMTLVYNLNPRSYVETHGNTAASIYHYRGIFISEINNPDRVNSESLINNADIATYK